MNRSAFNSASLPALIALSPASGGMSLSVSVSRGTGAGAGVIPKMKSGSLASICSTDRSEYPGNGPASGRPAARFFRPSAAATAPEYDSGFAA